MKNLLALFLLSFSVAHATIIPSDKSLMLVTDELFPYQWGLLNQEQVLIKEKDDIHNLPLTGVVGSDIGWDRLVGNFVTRRPVIAVLDSGVDLTHPELQGNLWRNEAECGKDPKVDNDGNQLAGDCNGWNFTEDINSDEAKDPTDRDGHGTHIAGLIAALNNGIGMVGVTPNALIMPIKVMRDSNSSSAVPSSEAFARGITYAVDNGADVINMSLGWPKALETKLLRDAVYYALKNGVPIIAAAGNNNSSEPLFPCAYDGVICVASTTVDGNFAGFSNFGGHVDTVAPGESILGLNPILYEPELFSVPGYELRSGTSQSAPFVTGLIAALKAKKPEITIDDLFAKLYQGEMKKDSHKYVSGTPATWSVLNEEIHGPVVRPVLKKLREVIFRGESTTSEIELTIRNFGLTSGKILVHVESLSPGVEFQSESREIVGLKQGEFSDLIFAVELKDLNAESNIKIKVSVDVDGEMRSFTSEIPVIRDLDGDPKYIKNTFSFKANPLPVGGVRNGAIVPLISTVESYGKSTKHEYFMRRTLKDENKLEITLFTKQDNKFVQAKNLILIDNAKALVNFIRVDLNFDGLEDYLVQTVAEKEGKKFFQFSFYNQDLLPLWGSFQQVKVQLELYVENMNDLFFMKYAHQDLGKIMVPAFFTMGQLPKVDQVLTSWDRLDTSRKMRLYFLEPTQNNELRLRSLINNTWEEKVKKELKAKWFETVGVESLLPPSQTDRAHGKLRALVSTGQGTKRSLFIHTFDATSETHGTKLPQLVLQSENVDPLISFTDSGLVNSGDVFFNVYDRTRSKLVITQNESQLTEFIFRHDSESDLIAGHISTFQNGSERFSVFQTREELISVSTDGTRSSRPKLRYSFLSQKLLSEMYFPVAYRRNGSLVAALYVDATSVTGNRVYLFENQGGQLVSSIRNSIIVPSNCRSLNPVFSEHSKTYEFNFLCLEEKEFVIRSYEIN